MVEQDRAVELTADAPGRTVRIDPGGRTLLMGRLVRIPHKLVRGETETRLVVEVGGDQRVSVGFSAIGVVDRMW